MMEKVRVGIIGLGWFGEIHTEAYRNVRNAEVVALCERRPDRLAEVARKHGIKKTYQDYNDLLADPDIDALSICTHGPDHVEPMIAALKSGKHILLEKPMANSLESIDKIMAAAKDCKQNIMIGHICRFENDYAIARDEILAGRIGEIVSMYSRRNVFGPVAFPHLQNLPSILGDAVHDIDLMNWYVGSKAKSVYGMARNANQNVPNYDVGWVNIKYENAALAVAESCWCMPEGSPFMIDARMEIIGTKGIVYLNAPSTSLVIDDGKKRQVFETVYWPLVHGERSGAIHAELQYFADCIFKGVKPNMVPLEDSYHVVRICLAALESAKTGEVIYLK
jgi:UDP-N-acetylglucosamine 3-dehydrogenase